ITLSLVLTNFSFIKIIPNEAIQSLFRLGSDQRLLSRFDRWQWSYDAFLDSPIIGWGPGSAGSTLGMFFPDGIHVTPHNMYLKYAVETGIVGIALVLAILCTAFLRVIKMRNQNSLALPALLVLAVFSISDPALEEIPVTVGLGIIIGWAA